MCGIAGILSNNSAEGNLKAMLAAMKHRGPDDSGIWCHEGVHLGHNRLAIIDLTAAGHQPMISHSGRYVIVYNGEVYNFPSLRKELLFKGVRFHSHTDTEVILALWEQEGEACVSRLRGMFAFAIWDNLEKTLTLVRDRFGIKPLYYAQTINGFLFSSEIKGMLASGLVEKRINQVAVSHLLNTGYVIQPETILSEVYALLPGYILRYKDNDIHLKKYWNNTTLKNECNTEQEAIERIRSLIVESVAEEMVSDRPIGVFLSGGLDSTVLLAALRMSGHKHIKTFSVGFDSARSGLNEADDAAIAARHYDTEHTYIHAAALDLSSNFDEFIAAMDQPSIDGLNTWLVSKYTAPHVTVALSGLGGDELFSGYAVDRRMIFEKSQYNLLIKLFNKSRPIWNSLPLNGLRNRLEHWGEKVSLTDSYSQWGRLFNGRQVGQFGVASNAKHMSVVHKSFARFDTGNNLDVLQRITSLHLATFMHSRLLRDSDAVSMAHSMEVRFPLLDHRLVEFVLPLPMEWKLKKIKETAKLAKYEAENSYEKFGVKHLLYQAFKQELPKGFGARPKRGFHLPMQEWMQSGLKEIIRELLLANSTFLDSTVLSSFYDKWKFGKVPANKIWMLLILESWVKKYLAK